jgi:hypothetical protein
MKYLIQKIKNTNINTNEDIIVLFNKFVKENYGQFVYADPQTLKKEYNKWFIQVGISSPYYVENPGEEYPSLKFSNKPNIIYLEATSKGRYIEIKGLSRKYFLEKTKQREMMKNGNKSIYKL